MVWCEQTWSAGKESKASFAPERVTVPLIIRYRDYLKNEAACKPTTVNRYLISLKRYFAWATAQDLLARDPAQVVKLVGQETSSPRHLSDREEDALLVAVETAGNLRDRTLITLMLHTGLRVSEVCRLKPQHVKVGKRSGQLGHDSLDTTMGYIRGTQQDLQQAVETIALR